MFTGGLKYLKPINMLYPTDSGLGIAESEAQNERPH